MVMLVAMLLLLLKNRFGQQIDELQQKLAEQAMQLAELQSQLAQNQAQLSLEQQGYEESQRENEQVSKQLEQRIKMTQEQLNNQIQSIEQRFQQQPEDKLYSRAQKLVALGADITEIMRECDIPRAEAEMLLAVHRNKSSK